MGFGDLGDDGRGGALRMMLSVQINVEPHGPDAEQSGRCRFGSKAPPAHRGLVPDLYLVTSSDVQRWALSDDDVHDAVKDAQMLAPVLQI